MIRGNLRFLSTVCGMNGYFFANNIYLKDFAEHVEKITKELKKAALEEANTLCRPIQYLPSSGVRKEKIAKYILERDNIHEGLICILTSVEPCISFEIYRNRKEKRLELQIRQRKCLHHYHYWIDPVFGFMNARIQTWFPFRIQICLNGREWLSRELKKHNIGYIKKENCFIWLDNFEKSQQLANKQLEISWQQEMNRIAKKLNPIHDEIFKDFPIEYYWMVHQSECATDLIFNLYNSLKKLYSQLITGAIVAYSSNDVMRFLGGRTLTQSFKGEVISNIKKRPEGVRIKHQVKANSIKMYDKQGKVLRIETTINDPYDFKVFRTKEGNPNGEKKWLKMRKGIADLYHLSKISQGANNRYLESLAQLSQDKMIKEIIEPICKPTKLNKKRIRALRPWDIEDLKLFHTVNNGKYIIQGFRNRDLLCSLYLNKEYNLKDKKRISACITRKIRLLRAHKMVKKIPHTHRYLVTKKGFRIITFIIKSQNITLDQINKLVA